MLTRRRLPVATLVLWLSAAAGLARGPSIDGERLRFSLPDLEGQLLSSDDASLRGRVWLVTVWGTWCPPCRTEVPVLDALQERYGEDGLTVLAIAFEKEEDEDVRREELRRFVGRHEVSYRVLDGGTTTDIGAALPQLRNVSGVPIEILVGRDGRVVEVRNGKGYSRRWARKIEREVQELLAKPSGEAASGGE